MKQSKSSQNQDTDNTSVENTNMGDRLPLIESETDPESELEYEDIRIVLVGKTGGGKSATGNTILGDKIFTPKLSSGSVTEKCQKKTGQFDGKTLAVVDTPGLLTTKDKEETQREIVRSAIYFSPGPHVFLLVMQLNRFTEEEQGAVKQVQKIFGEEAADYTMVLFTRGDDLEDDGDDVETFISESPLLSAVINKCKNRYHVFNNKNKDPSQVRELMQKIDGMVQQNGGKYLTNKSYQKNEKIIQKETKKLQREYPSMEQKEARRQAEKASMSKIGVGAGAGAGVRAGIGAGVGLGVGAGVGGAAAVIIEAAIYASVGAVAGPIGAGVGAVVGLGVGIGAAVATMMKSSSKNPK